MKKALVLLLALCAVSAFAQDAAYTLSGDASLSWGYNLDTNDHGFNNDANFAIEFPLVTETETGVSGEGVYGTLTVTDINLGIKDSLDDGLEWTNPVEDVTVEAKVVAGAFYFTVYEKPSFTFNNAAFIKPYSIDEYDDFSSSLKSKLRAYVAIAGGTSVGYTLGDLGKVELRIASLGDWGKTDAVPDSYEFVVSTAAVTEAAAITAGYINLVTMLPWAAGDGAIAIGDPYLILTPATPASGDDRYAIGFNTTLTPIEMLTVNFGAMYVADTKYLGLTGKATLKPIEGLTVVGALDASKLDTADLKFDAFGSVAYAFNEAKDTFSVETYFADENANALTYGRLDLAVKFADVSGFVDGLSVDLGVFANDLIADPAFDPLKLTIAEKLSYKAMLDDVRYVKPYQAYATDLNLEATYLNAGVEAGLIPNTTFTVDYTFGEIADDVVGNAFVTGATADVMKGLLKITTKITL